MKSSLLLSTLLILSLTACVEIKDPNEINDEPPPQAEVTAVYNNLYVEKAAYLWEGKVLTEEEYKKSKSATLTAQKPTSYKFDNVDIAEGAVIYTLGQTLKIEITNLNSQGRLETFPEGQTAAAGMDGRSGGHIELYIQNPTGFLNIALRGEAGGNGANGERGKDGSPGTPSTSCHFRIAGEFERSLGGRGHPGGDGKAGGNGGNSGQLHLHIPETRDFVHPIKKFPGELGFGGKGNEGGNQGPQAPMCFKNVIKPLPLDPNLKGAPGKDAKDGISGGVESSCVYNDGRQPVCG